MTELILVDTRIRQDAHGRYCLNDLHKAAVTAGANARAKEPGKFFRSPRIQELVELLEGVPPNWSNETTQNLGSLECQTITPIWGNASAQNLGNAPVVQNVGGSAEDTGTYVCIELVIAYGQFVSAAFDLKVIRTFLATMHGEHAMPHIQSAKFWDALRPHWAPIAQLALAGLKNVQIAAQLKRSAASIGHCLRRMFEVGYLNPVAVFKARLKPATAARWAIAKPVAALWGRPAGSASAQLSLAL